MQIRVEFFKKQIGEIFSEKNLSIYGFILALSHVLTSYFFFKQSYDTSEIICWQFLQDCQVFSSVFLSALPYLICMYALLSLICAICFLLKKKTEAYFLFLAITIFKLVVHFSDYRFMGNYHYMSNIVNLAFLFLPNKKNIIKLMIVLFYVGAGLIKFNTDWFSGSALTNPSILSGNILIWACAYVIILETVFSFLLLSKTKMWFYFAFVQFLIFHIFSWHIVGYFYPLIMFSLISIFILNLDQFSWPTEVKNLVFVVVFALAQLAPLTMDADSSLTNKYRVFSLNMLDAYSVCETRLFIKSTDSVVEYKADFLNTAIRVHCDPLFALQKVKRTCEYFLNKNSFIDIDMDHQVRRKSNPNNIQQVTFQNVCSNPLKIHFLSGGLYQTSR